MFERSISEGQCRQVRCREGLEKVITSCLKRVGTKREGRETTDISTAHKVIADRLEGIITKGNTREVSGTETTHKGIPHALERVVREGKTCYESETSIVIHKVITDVHERPGVKGQTRQVGNIPK